MITNNVIIDSVKQVTTELKRRSSQEFKQHQVSKIMKEDMGLLYRRIQTVALHTNSDKNRILR